MTRTVVGILLLFSIPLASPAWTPDTSAVAPPGMTRITGGWFLMGRNNGGLDERPEHRVFVDSFWMSKTEVTVWEYLACVRDGRCRIPDWWNRRYFDDPGPAFSKIEWLSFPVMGVSWSDAMDFCRWKGNGSRLPTEAEWEYACRAGTRTAYFWGDDFSLAGRFANVSGQPQPVGRHEPNPWGLLDMIGNVWEWCLDCYSGDFYRKSPQINPVGPPLDPAKSSHVARGGSWNEYRWNLRCANRSSGEPGKGYKGLGFRTVIPIASPGLRVEREDGR
jgi:formylglycine-generating enzyme required for sulfatase activity